MKKFDIQFAVDFMNREEGSRLEIITSDESYYISSNTKLDYGEDLFVIKQIPKIPLNYNDIDEIKLVYESQELSDYFNMLKIVTDAWNQDFGGNLYIEYDNLYYNIDSDDFRFFSDNSVALSLDGVEKEVEFSDIDKMSISIKLLNKGGF